MLCFLPSLKRGMGFGWDIDIVEKDKEGKCPWRIAASATPPPSPKPPPHPANGVDGWSVLAFPLARLSCSTSPKSRQLTHFSQCGGGRCRALEQVQTERTDWTPSRVGQRNPPKAWNENPTPCPRLLHPTKKTGNLFLLRRSNSALAAGRPFCLVHPLEGKKRLGVKKEVPLRPCMGWELQR